MAEYEQPIHVPRFEETKGFYTTPERSRLMSRIKATDTKAELQLRRALWHLGYRYRVNVKSLPGKPDIAIKKYKIAVFVDGEFWHGHDWVNKRDHIKRNRAFWILKIERNMQRDREVTRQLQQMGYLVLRFWSKRVQAELDQCIGILVEAIEARKTL